MRNGASYYDYIPVIYNFTDNYNTSFSINIYVYKI